MSRHAGYGALAAFTSLAIAGAGLIVAAACLEAIHRRVPPPALVAGVLLQAAGLAVSLGHLGRKRRAARAVRGAGRSALSNEVLAAALALASAATAAGLGLWDRPVPAVTVIAGVANALFLVSVGLVYLVGGQQTWQGFSALTPLTGGCAFGAIAIQALSTTPGPLSLVTVIVVVDAVVFVQRWREVAATRMRAASLPDAGRARRDQLLGARLVLLDALPVVLMVWWPTPLTAGIAAAGVAADRIGFYALARQHTTEHEVAAVEDLMTPGGQTRN